MRWTLSVLFFFGFSALAQQVMHTAKLTSCNKNACSLLVSPEIHRSNLSPNIMAFADVTLGIFASDDSHKQLQSFKAADGYYDMQEHIIVLRELRDSKFKELIYNLETNAITYF